MKRSVVMKVGLLFSLLMAGGCAAKEPRGEKRLQGLDRCVTTIETYVQETRGWKREMYRIAEESSGTADIGFSVQHVHDRVLLPEGGLKSFHVDLDQRCSKVIRESHYQ
ncbi:MAG TPA: hypothetical protein DIW85_19115 [Stenotrophomonas sp.]|jgi:hypothetical protein|nr:hypothetical protein [Stenotrophomonas sp.]